MPDPGWAARTPEANDLLLKAGTGVGTHLANQTAWTTLGASHHASGVASAINTAATAASWLGVGSAASALNVTMLNATLHGLAGWVDVKPAVVSTAIAAFETANAAMRPAPECMENRDEWGVDNAINPSVLWTLTPRIVSLDVEYFGVMWPNNAAVGAHLRRGSRRAGRESGNSAAGRDHGCISGRSGTGCGGGWPGGRRGRGR